MKSQWHNVYSYVSRTFQLVTTCSFVRVNEPHKKNAHTYIHAQHTNEFLFWRILFLVRRKLPSSFLLNHFNRSLELLFHLQKNVLLFFPSAIGQHGNSFHHLYGRIFYDECKNAHSNGLKSKREFPKQRPFSIKWKSPTAMALLRYRVIVLTSQHAFYSSSHRFFFFSPSSSWIISLSNFTFRTEK